VCILSRRIARLDAHFEGEGGAVVGKIKDSRQISLRPLGNGCQWMSPCSIQ
jgi:hypothetical protein